MRRLIVASMSGLILALSAGIPAEAVAQEDGENSEQTDELTEAEQKKFKDLVKRGRTAFDDEKYDKALGLFKKAYDIKPSTNLLFNMGLISEKAGNLGEAVDYYERFIQSGGISLDMRKRVQKRLDVLRPIVENKEKKEKAADEKMPEDQGLKESDKDKESSDQKTASTPKDSGGTSGGGGGASALPKILVISGGASLLASGGMFLAAQSNKSNFESGETASDRRTARQWYTTNTYIADAFLLTGVGLATTGAIMWLSGGGSGSGQAAAKTPSVTPAVTTDGFGVSITGSF